MVISHWFFLVVGTLTLVKARGKLVNLGSLVNLVNLGSLGWR